MLSKKTSYQVGLYAEFLVRMYLRFHGYRILEKRYITGKNTNRAEIDIIAKDLSKNELVFVEVKTRLNFNFGRPAQSVTAIKKKHLLCVANYYLFKNSIQNTFIRFDVIEVFVKKFQFMINHIKQIF